MSEKSDKAIEAIYNLQSPQNIRPCLHLGGYGVLVTCLPVEKLLGVDKKVDTFVPLTGL